MDVRKYASKQKKNVFNAFIFIHSRVLSFLIYLILLESGT